MNPIIVLFTALTIRDSTHPRHYQGPSYLLATIIINIIISLTAYFSHNTSPILYTILFLTAEVTKSKLISRIYHIKIKAEDTDIYLLIQKIDQKGNQEWDNLTKLIRNLIP